MRPTRQYKAAGTASKMSTLPRPLAAQSLSYLLERARNRRSVERRRPAMRRETLVKVRTHTTYFVHTRYDAINSGVVYFCEAILFSLMSARLPIPVVEIFHVSIP